MPAKKTTKKKKTQDKKTVMTPQVEVLPAEVSHEKNPYGNALARVNTVLAVRGGNPVGTISEQRSSHYSGWDELLKEDRRTRSQILELKSKENEVLNLIKNRVADGLIETIDSAVAQGLLHEPEEV